MSLTIGTPIISSLTRLASTVIEVWKAWKDANDRHLDRVHQEKLQRHQHQHELLIENIRIKKDLLLERIRSENQTSGSPSNSVEDALIARLEFEARILSEMDYDVIFEPVSDGYGLALLIKPNYVLVFWISNRYPEVEPRIYINTKNRIDRIDFAAGVWNPLFTLAEIVQALHSYDVND